MADSSFDIVSKIDRQEVDNALGQAAREIATRFDFKGTGAKIEWQGEHAIEITAIGSLSRETRWLDGDTDELVSPHRSRKCLVSAPRFGKSNTSVAGRSRPRTATSRLRISTAINESAPISANARSRSTRARN